MRTKFTFVDSIISTVQRIQSLFSNVGGTPPQIVNTVNVRGVSKEVVFLDMSFYAPYKPLGDSILSALIVIGFAWSVFTRLPNIINGISTSTHFIDKGGV